MTGKRPMDEVKLLMGWYNYRTEQYDYLADAPEDYTDYIPQNTAAQGLYRLHIEMGKQPAMAALDVLRRSMGEESD